ncbi:hypothetical protein HanRHA438_Chr09g0408551 [Helianthus annuus]|nr:hypothetical protein HanRHA438_Chr09g0408551 [Helianthus annuus]
MKEVIGLHQIKGPDPSYNDICFAGAGSDVSQLSKTFPTVEMVFGKGQKLSLSPRTTCSGTQRLVSILLGGFSERK